MRWEALFDDLAAGAAAEIDADRRAEVADRTRAEIARLRLIDRLRPLLGSDRDVRVAVGGSQVVTGGLRGLGIDWLLLNTGGASETLIPLAVVQWVQGLEGATAEPGWEGQVGSRLSLRVALRRVVRDRSAVVITLNGSETFAGRLGRVGADFVELELDDVAGSGRAPTNALTVPIAALASVRRR